MTATDAKNHMEDIKEELKLLLFHEQTLLREIELLRPMVESKIVLPRRTTDLRNISRDDLNIDVVPANMADMPTIQARKAFYYAPIELAQTKAAIDAKKELYNTYKAHMQQELEKQNKPCTDEMIFEVFHKAQALKNLSPEEAEALKGISETLMKDLNSGRGKRLEILETLTMLVKQHG